MIITITEDIVKQSKEESAEGGYACLHCPIHVAMREQVEEEFVVSSCYLETLGTKSVIPLSPAARRFISKFDNNEEIELPVSFEVYDLEWN